MLACRLRSHAEGPTEHAPAFALPDERDHLVTLDELRTHGPVVLVFYRGHW